MLHGPHPAARCFVLIGVPAGFVVSKFGPTSERAQRPPEQDGAGSDPQRFVASIVYLLSVPGVAASSRPLPVIRQPRTPRIPVTFLVAKWFRHCCGIAAVRLNGAGPHAVLAVADGPAYIRVQLKG